MLTKKTVVATIKTEQALCIRLEVGDDDDDKCVGLEKKVRAPWSFFFYEY